MSWTACNAEALRCHGDHDDGFMTKVAVPDMTSTCA